jgi:hypothetical protein
MVSLGHRLRLGIPPEQYFAIVIERPDSELSSQSMKKPENTQTRLGQM